MSDSWEIYQEVRISLLNVRIVNVNDGSSWVRLDAIYLTGASIHFF
jgi:hypothetical protein